VSAQGNGLADFAAFCSRLKLEDGSPFELEPFQSVMLEDYFAGVTETLILISKKNGKSTLLAALALHHLVTTDNAMCPVAAASREQAMWIFDQARGFVQRSRELQSQVRVLRGYREIRRRLPSEPDNPKEMFGLLKVLAADEDTADGVIPTLGLVDELHRHKKAELYAVFADGLGPRNGQMITISTAGSAIDSPLGRLRAKARELEGATSDPETKYTYARSGDGQFALHEWSLDAEDDVEDMEVVKLANPASWQTVEALRRRHDSPSTTPGQWRRFACGIWTEGDETWLRPEAWDRLRVAELSDDEMGRFWVGVDVGVKHDTTAVVTVSAGEDGAVVVRQCRILKPGSGGELPLKDVEAAIREVCEECDVEAVLFDPWTFRRSAEILADEGLPMVEFPQSPERMSNASENLYRLIESGALVHDGDPALRAHVMGGATKATERGWRLVKDPRAPRPIDALIALAMAALPASQNLVEEPAFAWA
jgi:phage terminase large subunit-like protein